MKSAKNSKHKQKNYLINLILISTPLEKTITPETVNFILECLMTNLNNVILWHNLQCSPPIKTNSTQWAEEKNENLRCKLCTILKEAVNVDFELSDVLAIYRIPGGMESDHAM